MIGGGSPPACFFEPATDGGFVIVALDQILAIRGAERRTAFAGRGHPSSSPYQELGDQASSQGSGDDAAPHPHDFRSSALKLAQAIDFWLAKAKGRHCGRLRYWVDFGLGLREGATVKATIRPPRRLC